MPGNSCIIYTSIFFRDLEQMKLEFERNQDNFKGHYEIRYDLFTDRSLENLEGMMLYLNSHKIDYIFTFRSTDKKELGEVYGTALRFTPPIIDIDINSFIFEKNIFNKSKLMISFHGTDKDDVSMLLKSMSRLNPDIYKIALTYTDPGKFLKDIQYIYTFRKEHGIKIAYIPMGKENSFLRIVSAYIVSDYSYASYVQSTAPGQISQGQFKAIMEMFR